MFWAFLSRFVRHLPTRVWAMLDFFVFAVFVGYIRSPLFDPIFHLWEMMSVSLVLIVVISLITEIILLKAWNIIKK